MAGPLVPHVGFEISELSLGDEPSMYTGRMTSPSTEAREADVSRGSAQLQAVKNEASAEHFGSLLAPPLGAPVEVHRRVPSRPRAAGIVAPRTFTRSARRVPRSPRRKNPDPRNP